MGGALTITDTTYFSSVSNRTIFVDSITLDEVIVTNQTIQFHNLTSLGSNFTNANATYEARADFIGLDIGIIVRNVNTSTNLFTSSAGAQSFNATFAVGQVIQTTNSTTDKGEVGLVCTSLLDAFSTIGQFLVIIILAIIVVFIIKLFRQGEFDGRNFIVTNVVAIGLVGIITILMIILINGICP